MPSSPLSVSVVIPAHNAERFLARAIASASNQAPAPVEILVVDDGSTDRTGDIARGSGGLVRCIRQDNAGCASARNRGIREAAGEFIAFLDADDEWLPGHLHEAVRVLTEHPHLHWFCAAFEIRNQEGQRSVRRYAGPLLINDAYIDNYLRAHSTYSFSWTTSMVVRKSVLEEVGGFEQGMRRGSDVDGWFRIGLRHRQVGYSSKVTSVYHQRADSITSLATEAESERLLKRIGQLEHLAMQHDRDTAEAGKAFLTSWVNYLAERAFVELHRRVLIDAYRQHRSSLTCALRALISFARIVPDGRPFRLYARFALKCLWLGRLVRQWRMKT